MTRNTPVQGRALAAAISGWFACALATLAAAAAEPPSGANEQQLRERYEQVLRQNPFQERAFHHVFESYLNGEGVARWIDALQSNRAATNRTALLLLGQIHDRQFNASGALEHLEQAARLGEDRPEFKALLGTLYYKAGQDDRAADLLRSALDSLADLDRRASVCRTLGSLLLRQGKRDQAVAVWKRIADQPGDEVFARQELAEIYEDNRLWDEAIALYRLIAASAQEDPYRRCRALRSVGQCLLQLEKHHEAIAVLEQALELVAPGNWLFEDLKTRLVGVYEDTGDLAGLVRYLQARLEQAPDNAEFHELLAEAYARQGQLDRAEREHRLVLERNPRSAATYEKLIALQARQDRTNEVIASLEKLIELFPADTEYVRRLGEVHWHGGDPGKAKATWQRIAGGNAAADRFAELAGWYESFKLPDEAVRAYEQALAKSRNKDWVFRLAALQQERGAAAAALKLWLSVLDPATSQAGDYAEVAAILESNQLWAEALKLRRQAAQAEPANWDHALACARTLMKLEQYEAALTEFTRLAGQANNDYLRQQGESGRLEAYAGLGRLDEKRQEWERALEQNPKSVTNLALLARVYERTGQREKSVAMYERWRDLDPGNIESWRLLAEAYRRSRQSRQAAAAYHHLLERDKGRARVYLKELLELHLTAEAREEACATAERIVALAPNDPEARLELAQVYVLFLDKDKGFEQYRHALRLAPNEPEYHRQFGEALVAEKRWAEAQSAFRRMLDVANQDQTRLNAVQHLARLHAQLESIEELTAEFSRRLRNTPKKLAAYEELAAIHREAGQSARAIEILEGGLQAVDDKPAALRSLIRLAHESRDLPRVRRYFEQLIALTGKPSVQDYERLAELYAQSGDADKARATWDKILESAPADAKLLKRIAGTMRDEGFADEALALQARAVERAPLDYQLRYAYAQSLVSVGQPQPALEQLQRLLELGPGPSTEATNTGAAPRSQPPTLTRTGRAAANPYLRAQSLRRTRATTSSSSLGVTPVLTSVLSGFGSLTTRTGWQGSYEDFRPQVVGLMANLAANVGREETVLKSWQSRVSERPGDLDAKRDLLQVLLAFDRAEPSVKLAEEILAAAPGDLEVVQFLAQLYESQGGSRKSVALLERLAEDPARRTQAVLSLVRIHFASGDDEKATALAQRLLAERPAEYSILYTLGNTMLRQGETNLARTIFERGLTLDPRYHRTFQTALTGLYRRTGQYDQAVAFCKEMLLASLSGPATGRSRQSKDLYQPTALATVMNSSSSSSATRLRRIPATVMEAADAATNSPFGHLLALKASGHSAFDPIPELDQIARGYKPVLSPAERTRAWGAARVLFAHYIAEDQPENLRQLLDFLRAAGKEDLEWFNVAIYLRNSRTDYDGMLALYDEVAKRQPARARDALLAKARTLNLARRFEEAAAVIREINQQPLAPREFLQLIQPLTGYRALAVPLLEGYLAQGSRHPDVLSMLARLCAADRDYDRAVALAAEAYERRPQNQGSSSALVSSRVISTTSGSIVYSPSGTASMVAPSSVSTDALLRELYNYHSSAGRKSELMDKFKQRLEKQPNSASLLETIGQLHFLAGERDQALAVYQALAGKYPHLLQVKLTIARLLADKGENSKAVELCQDLLQRHPESASQINATLRAVRQPR